MNPRHEVAGSKWGVGKWREVEEGSKVREAGVLRVLRFCEIVSSTVDRETRRNSRNKWALAQSRKEAIEVSERCAFQCTCRETELRAQWWVTKPRRGRHRGHFRFSGRRSRGVRGSRGPQEIR